MKNTNIGAKVKLWRVLVDIKPRQKQSEQSFIYKYSIKGTIVSKEFKPGQPNDNYEFYYHTSDGMGTSKDKHIIEKDCYSRFAIKLDNKLKDIDGNNIIIVRKDEITFLETTHNTISKSEYKKALKTIAIYEKEQN